MSTDRAHTVKLVIAFAAVYLIWGSTYLGMHYATETIPPLVMVCMRNLFGGSVLYFWSRFRGAPPRPLEKWRTAFIAGVLMLTCGNGGVVLAVQRVPSGLTAVMVAGVPMWIAILNWMRPGGKRPAARVALGIALGLAGVATLIGLGNLHSKDAIDHIGAATLVLSSIGWASGSLFSSMVRFSDSPIQSAGMQMLGGGCGLLVASIVSGEIFQFHPASVSVLSWSVLAYLTLFGSIIAFTAYSWLLKATTPARAVTYAYVNPLVAVFLGWALDGEPLTPRAIAAMIMIVLAVIVITTARQRVLKTESDMAQI